MILPEWTCSSIVSETVNYFVCFYDRFYLFLALIAGLVSFILLQLISLMSFVLLVRGTRTRLAQQIKPSVILFAMFSCLALLALFAKLTPSSIVNFVFNFYIFVLLFSLWKKYKEEYHARGGHIIITHNPNFIPIAFQEKA